MEENNVTNVENTGYVVPSTNSDDSMFVMLVKTLVVVLLGGLITKLIKKFVNYIKEGQRLRREEKQRKETEEFEKMVEKKAQEKLDALLAEEIKSKEESKD